MLSNPEYMIHDEKVDVWPLGLIAYYALHGRDLFTKLDNITSSYYNVLVF